MQQSQGGLVLKMIKIFILLSVLLPSLWGQGYTIPVAGNTNANIPSYICTPAGANTTTYTCSPSPSPSSYTSGMILAFKPDVTNTGSSTVNVNGLGAKTIQKIVSGTLTNLDSGDLDSDGVYLLRYNGTVFITDSDSSISGIIDAQYLALFANGTLTDERVFTVGIGLSGADAGAGSTYTLSLDTAVAETRANLQGGDSVYSVTAGTSTAYTAALSPTATSDLYSNGASIRIKMDEASGDCPTLNVDTLGARKVYKRNGTSASACVTTGELRADQTYTLVYNSSLDSGIGGWETDIGGGGSGGGAPDRKSVV